MHDRPADVELRAGEGPDDVPLGCEHRPQDDGIASQSLHPPQHLRVAPDGHRLQLLDLLAQPVDELEIAGGSCFQDVGQQLRRTGVGAQLPLHRPLDARYVVAVDGDEGAGREEDVELVSGEPVLRHPRAVADDERQLVVLVDLGELVRRQHVGDGVPREPERPGDVPDVGQLGAGEVEPVPRGAGGVGGQGGSGGVDPPSSGVVGEEEAHPSIMRRRRWRP